MFSKLNNCTCGNEVRIKTKVNYVAYGNYITECNYVECDRCGKRTKDKYAWVSGQSQSVAQKKWNEMNKVNHGKF